MLTIIKNIIISKKFLAKIYFITLIAVGLVTIKQTYWLMPLHFTHVDDIGVAESLLIRNLDYQNNCQKNLNEFRGRVLSTFISDPDRVCNLTTKLNRLWIIPGVWTYAPAQFWLTQALMDPHKKYSYEEVKFLGRLPSFIFYVLGALAFYGLMRSSLVGISKYPTLSLALSLLMILSLENRIFASQMHSYAIGVLANTFAFFAYLRLLKFQTHSFQSILVSSIIFSLSVAMQYQALLMVLAGLCCIFFVHLFKYKCFNLPFIKRYLFLVATTFFATYTLVGNILGLASKGLNWNVGPNGEFIVKGINAIDRFLAFIKLLFTQTPENIYAILSGVQLPDLGAYIFGTTVSFLFAFGILHLWRNRAVERNAFLMFFLSFYALIYFSLILLGKLSFAPTRHFLFYLPVIVIMLGYGVIEIKKWIPISFMKGAFLVYCLVVLALFPSFAQGRLDKLSTGLFTNLAREENASFLLSGMIDIEPIFTESASQLPLFWGPSSELNCMNKEILISSDKVVRFLTYSKSGLNYPPILENAKYIEDLIVNCTNNFVVDKKILSIQYLRHLVDSPSKTSNELSNRVIQAVHNNNSFISLFEVKTNFDSNLYNATLDEGIDFKKQAYPAFLKFVSGISQREDWGRWTDANLGRIALLGFRDPLPKRFTLELTTQSFPENAGRITLIRVGKQEKTIISDGKSNQHSLDFENDGAVNLIEIIPPKSIVNNNAGPSSLDPRRIGLGLIALKIKSSEK
jgi:hypothetical protein